MITLYLDRGINWLKWPVALMTIVTLPAAVVLFGTTLLSSFDASMQWFWIGFLAYISLWYIFFKNRAWGSWLPTFEHELSHAIFAWLTFHRVTDFHASWEKGGHVRYVGGEGNWLITIAPYFFPFFPLLFALVYVFQPAIFQGFFYPSMGFVLGFQACSTWTELHSNQPDLKKVGWFFSACFLPTINLLTYTWFVSVLQGKESGKLLNTFMEIWWEHYLWLTHFFRSL